MHIKKIHIVQKRILSTSITKCLYDPTIHIWSRYSYGTETVKANEIATQQQK